MAERQHNDILAWLWYISRSLAAACHRNLVPDNAQKKKSVQNKRALVTGAGGGIGRQIALNLAKQGCNLVLWDLFEAPNAVTAQQCRDLGVDVSCEVVDVTDREQVYARANVLLSLHGAVDILVNNAGVISDSNGGFLSCDDARVETLMKVNIMSHFWTVKAFLPAMLEQGTGHIVSIASVAGICGAPDLVDYSTSKFAAIGFMQALEADVQKRGHDGIKFTTVCPCFVDTALLQDNAVRTMNVKLLSPERVGKAVVAAIQLQRHMVFIPDKFRYANAAKGILPWNLWKSLIFKRRYDLA